VTEAPWPKESPKNIIVRMPSWLGDLVMATPVLRSLRQHFPKANITAMCQGAVNQLLTHDPNINDIYSFKKPSGWIHRAKPLEIIETLKKGQYDLGVLLTNSYSSAYWFWAGNVENRLGYTKGLRDLLLNKAVKHPENAELEHLVITYKALVAPLGIPVSNDPPKLYISRAEQIHAHHLLKKYGIPYGRAIVVGINPGAAYGSAKCWLPERFKEVTKQLLKNPNVYVVYFGDNSGAALVNDICQNMPERVVNLAAKTNLRELMALIESCSIFLTNDSGPMHIAAALNKPLLALFGSTSDVKTGPYPKGIVIHKHVECSPCFKRVCPIDFRCMTSIGVDEVYSELEKMIKESDVA